MKKLAIVLLIVLILLLLLPAGMGVALMGCPQCHTLGASSGIGLCLAVLVSLAILLLGLSESTPSRRPDPPLLLLVRALDRPPRSL